MPRKRQSQVERSEATRRLLEATLVALLEEGHAATSISSIIKRAGVNRGAHLHHFPNWNRRLRDAAEHLLCDAYRRLGDALLATTAADDRLEHLLSHIWTDLCTAPVIQVFTALLVAGQRDRPLAQVPRRLASASIEPMAAAARALFPK